MDRTVGIIILAVLITNYGLLWWRIVQLFQKRKRDRIAEYNRHMRMLNKAWSPSSDRIFVAPSGTLYFMSTHYLLRVDGCREAPYNAYNGIQVDRDEVVTRDSRILFIHLP